MLYFLGQHYDIWAPQCMYTVTGGLLCPMFVCCDTDSVGVTSCVCILWRGGVSCRVSVSCDGVGCHVMCMFTVRWWGVMSCDCILWGVMVSCHVSLYCDGMGCRVLIRISVISCPVHVCALQCGVTIKFLAGIVGIRTETCKATLISRNNQPRLQHLLEQILISFTYCTNRLDYI